MARIIRHSEVYQEVSLSLFRELDVQAALASRAALLFPGYIYARFTGEVYDEDHGYKIPDFVLIEKGYRRWYVGEVELADHNLYNHVLPQVRTFRDGEYTDHHAELVVGHCPRLDLERLKLLFASTPPGVIVVVNRIKEAWLDAIHSQGALLALFEIFQMEGSADFLFRVDGDSVELFESFVSHCVVDTSWQQALKILTPAAMPYKDSEQITLMYKSVATDWLFRTIGTKGWLMPVRSTDFPVEEKFDLSFSEQQYLHLIPWKNAPQRRS